MVLFSFGNNTYVKENRHVILSNTITLAPFLSEKREYDNKFTIIGQRTI